MKNFWKSEPTLITGFVAACIGLAIAYNLPVDARQAAAINAFVIAALALVNRSQVTSPATLDAMTPATLSAAQSTLEPVKDVVKKLPVVLLACLLAGASFGCAGSALTPKAPPNLPPVVEAKFYATYAIKDLDVIRDFANDASQTTPPIISKATLLIVVDWHESLVKLIHAAPDGWKRAALVGIGELMGKLSAADQKAFKPYIDGALLTIQELP